MNAKIITATIIGGAVGFFCGYTYCSKRKEDYIHQQIVEARQHMDSITNDLLKQNEKMAREEKSENDSKPYTPYSDSERVGTDDDTISLREYLDRVHAEEYKSMEDLQEEVDSYRNVRGETREQELTRRNNAKPIQITEEDFGQPEDHELVAFSLYADGALTDDVNEPVEEPENMVGCTVADLMDLMNLSSKKILYFRNEKYQLEIEISWDPRNYSDIVKAQPYLKE